MKTLSNTLSDVNSLACESFVTPSPRLARVSFAFTPVPHNIGEVLTPIEERLYRILISLAQRALHGIVECCVRVLGSIIHRSRRQTQRILRSMERKGVLETIERQISSNRNAPNLYKLLGLVFQGGVGVKTTAEKNRKLLKTTTAERSIAALKDALRRMQDERDHERMLRRYEKRGELMLSKAVERTKRAAAACLGMYTGPKTPDDAEVAAAWWQRDREREKARLEAK
jgi:hypothetical protein